MHIVYYPDEENWELFLDSQNQNQFGSGVNYSYFKGNPLYQHGNGIGSILKAALRFLLPIGREIGQEGLRTSSRILNRVVQGENVKESMKKEGKTALGNLLTEGTKHLREQTGEGLLYAKCKKPICKRKRDALGFI